MQLHLCFLQIFNQLNELTIDRRVLLVLNFLGERERHVPNVLPWTRYINFLNRKRETVLYAPLIRTFQFRWLLLLGHVRRIRKSRICEKRTRGSLCSRRFDTRGCRSIWRMTLAAVCCRMIRTKSSFRNTTRYILCKKKKKMFGFVHAQNIFVHSLCFSRQRHKLLYKVYSNIIKYAISKLQYI